MYVFFYSFFLMKILAMVSRLFLGLIMFVFGANKLLNFMDMGGPTGDMAVFMDGLMASGYVMPLVAIVMVVSGLMLLLNRYVALGLVLMAPLTINFVLAHVFMEPNTIVMALLVFILNWGMMWSMRGKYKALLTAK